MRHILIIFIVIASFSLAAKFKGSFDYSARYYSFKVVNQLKVVKMKKCRKCLEIKLNDEFYQTKKNKDKMRSYCKSCSIILVKKYHRTKQGLISSIYRSQKQSSITRNHKPPQYKLIELRIWALKQYIFHLLYDNWINSNHDKWLRPSFDRKNSNLPYSLSNLKIMIWKENLDNNSMDIRSNRITNLGLLNGGHKSVIGINKKTGEKHEFISISEASRKLNISHGNISSVCLGVRMIAGGYIWSYKT